MPPDPPAEPGPAAAGAGQAATAGPAAGPRAAHPDAEAPAARTDASAPQAPPGGPEELYELGGRLLESGDAARAAEVFALALEPAGPGHPGRGQLLCGLGIARLVQALAAFAEAADCADASVRPLDAELLARGLPLRDRDDEAAAVWQRGGSDHDPEAAAAVRARLRAGLGAGAEAP